MDTFINYIREYIFIFYKLTKTHFMLVIDTLYRVVQAQLQFFRRGGGGVKLSKIRILYPLPFSQVCYAKECAKLLIFQNWSC